MNNRAALTEEIARREEDYIEKRIINIHRK